MPRYLSAGQVAFLCHVLGNCHGSGFLSEVGACLQVKHNAEELNEGETVILTLADRNILDDKGDLDDEADELENALVVCLPSTGLMPTQQTKILHG